jgi:two-component system response regulator PilR (NtrC family)
VKRVLIVDDEPLIRSGLSKALKGLAVVETADSGAQAIARINTRFYDVCFLDVFLPDASGLDLMRTIQKLSPTTRIAVMTAYADETTREVIRKEAYRFLEKPLDLSQIREIVGEPSSEK